jgi:hypothetical protein
VLSLFATTKIDPVACVKEDVKLLISSDWHGLHVSATRHRSARAQTTDGFQLHSRPSFRPFVCIKALEKDGDQLDRSCEK